MAKLTGAKDYTAAQVTKVYAAFSFLNEDGSPATDAQMQEWIDRQVESKVLQHYSRIEGAKADVAAADAVRNL